MPNLPFVSCLCPTYKRPQLLANAVACFQTQDYEGPMELVVLDDAGTIQGFVYKNELARGSPERCSLLFSVPHRFPSLPCKYNWLARGSQGSILVVWEDDDIYLPWHVSCHVETLRVTNGQWSKPYIIGSTYPGHLVEESSAGRFHGSMAITRKAFNETGGWPETDSRDYDMQMFKKLTDLYMGPADPIKLKREVSYVFRWGSTHAYHGSSYDMMTWYHEVGKLDKLPSDDVIIEVDFDEETRGIYAQLSAT